jgi:hypothetical protein
MLIIALSEKIWKYYTETFTFLFESLFIFIAHVVSHYPNMIKSKVLNIENDNMLHHFVKNRTM